MLLGHSEKKRGRRKGNEDSDGDVDGDGQPASLGKPEGNSGIKWYPKTRLDDESQFHLCGNPTCSPDLSAAVKTTEGSNSWHGWAREPGTVPSLLHEPGLLRTGLGGMIYLQCTNASFLQR